MVSKLSEKWLIVTLLNSQVWEWTRGRLRIIMRHTVLLPPQWLQITLIGLVCMVLMGMEGKGQEIIAEKGKGIYQRLCVACHGETGGGDGYALFHPPPKDLQASATQKKTDKELLDTIRNGHPNTAMGAWKYALSEEEMRQVLAYIRKLGQEQ